MERHDYEAVLGGRVEQALAFLNRHEHERPVEAAWARAFTGQGSTADVMTALAQYQNEDGGIGNGFEPDIAAFHSQAFAARLALQVATSLDVPSDVPVLTRLVAWLEATQDDDGCWRFPDGMMEHPVAPWFQGWTFPNLNPALDLAGLLARTGLGSERLHARCRALYRDLASVDEIETGQFYVALPYAEALPWLPDLPNRDEHLQLMIDRITRDLRDGSFSDPQHAFEYIGPPGGPIANALPADLIQAEIARMLQTQEADGGWPVAYGEHWRPWATATNVITLAMSA